MDLSKKESQERTEKRSPVTYYEEQMDMYFREYLRRSTNNDFLSMYFHQFRRHLEFLTIIHLGSAVYLVLRKQDKLSNKKGRAKLFARGARGIGGALSKRKLV